MFQTISGKTLALFSGVLLICLWAVLYIGDSGGETMRPSSPEEHSTVAVARSYISQDKRYDHDSDRPAWIRRVRGQWEVHFPPPNSVTHTGGPVITVDPNSKSVVSSWMTD